MNLYTVFSMILVISVNIPDILSYPSGNVGQSCTDMNPLHGATPQTPPSPYEIKLSTTSYTAGSTVQVTIVSNCGNEFRGFMIQARRADTAAADRTTPIGSFTAVTDTKPLCGSGSNRGLVHSRSVARSSLTLTWTAPATIQGHIVFKVTTVEKPNSRYWQAVTSEAVKDSSGPLNLASDSNQTQIGCTTQVENKFAADTRCGDTVGCYSDCDSTGQCTYLATWVLDSTNINFTIKAIPDSDTNVYAAIGFSTDTKMGDDSVIECMKTTDLRVATSFNNGRSNTRNADQLGITLTSASYENKILECVFTREITGSGDVKLVDLNTPHYMFFAQGTAEATGAKINQHGLIPTVSPQAIDFKLTENFSAVPYDKSKVLAHGALMVIAWITAASIGLVVARYFKPIWPNSTFIGQKIWFQIHRTCMILTLLSTCIAFIIIFVEVDGWTMSNISVEQAHPYLGVIVTFLTIVNPIMALFRPHPNTDNRYIFNWAHWGVGTVAYILGVITVAIGTRMGKANLSENAVWIVVGFTVWQLLVVLCLELVQLIGNKQKTDSYELQGGQSEKIPDTQSKPANGTLKQAILIIHIVVVLAFTIGLLVYIGLA
ncbi:hypothetical protein LOTGIDRAFT_162635 [Lottia gigantea]|uniref:Ferric-chelate reductase 1 n=1 Tax=Lottia gigantea TaxID=225164 RepID=V4AG13_LOTGI|nr:hypothetical protein LOTGIDRAFT_162635 [Lottia gigantea]ESO92331.1 hypothetical protein LOTGIDRAFT_162635 [Lottia gigantea]